MAKVEGFHVAGAFGASFYGTRDHEVVRVDGESGGVSILVDEAALRSLCRNSSGDWRPSPWLTTPPDERPLAIVQTGCGCVDCADGGSLALQLETGSQQIIQLGGGRQQTFQVTWPTAGGALIMYDDL